ncbi:MAG TPA: hypothetical protein DCG69_10265 [Bacteroidales bacterium]|nr:hypothetical protein [Bacteroidales bacterium]
MKTTAYKFTTRIILTVLFFISVSIAFPQEAPPPPDDHGAVEDAAGGGAPIGEGIVLLLSLGLVYGLAKLHNKKELELF